MVDVSSLSSNLVFPILLLLPGLLGLKVFLHRTDSIDAYSRLDATVYSVGISMSSVLVLYSIYGVYLWHLPTFTDLQFFSLALLIGIYLGHVGISTLSGEVAGRVSNWNGSDGRDTTRKELWDYAFDDIYSDSRIRVFTIEGSEIEGTVVRAGQPLQSRDLILAGPYELEHPGSQGTKRAVSLGDYVYVHEQAVSHVAFYEDLNDDLDLETLRQLGYEPVDPERDGSRDRGERDADLEQELRRELEGPGESADDDG